MQQHRHYVISLAGFDPSAGAGILADIKTFEQLGVYGLGVCSALTIQMEDRFHHVQWITTEQIVRQLHLLLEKYDVEYIKIGIVESLSKLHEILLFLSNHFPKVKAIWDPVRKTSTGFEFHPGDNVKEFTACCRLVHLITPNAEEAKAWTGKNDAMAAAVSLQPFTNIFLKSYQAADGSIMDVLLQGDQRWNFDSPPLNGFKKHGSGCVLSAAITALLAQGNDMKNSCGWAKSYTFEFLKSATDLLGEHHSIKLPFHHA